MGTGGTILEVDDVSVDYATHVGPKRVLHNVSFRVKEGQCLALVGESGSGKSTLAMALTGLLPQSATLSGRVYLRGRDIVSLSQREIENIRGSAVSVIFQNPMTSLNPTTRVGTQIAEQLRRHLKMGRRAANMRAEELLETVQIRDVRTTARSFPHQLSGGMRQRVMIAMAISCEPSIIIADEPTTALDVTVQAHVLSILDDLRKQLNMALILVTHDMGVVTEMADDVAVMNDGRFVEVGSQKEIFEDPIHPYTKGLLLSQPRIGDSDARHRRLPTIPKPVPMLDTLPAGIMVTNDSKPGVSSPERVVLIGNQLKSVERRTAEV